MPLNEYFSAYKNNDMWLWNETLALEELGRTIILQYQECNLVEKSRALEFINRVETWKAMKIPGRVKGVGVTTENQAHDALKKVLSAGEPKDKIESLHYLTGFGRSIPENQQTHPAKVASAALRFLYPEDWGVVDWRSAAIALLLKKLDYSIDSLLREAATINPRELKKDLSHIDANGVIAFNAIYSSIGDALGVEENARVDQVLFGISLTLWPLASSKRPCS